MGDGTSGLSWRLARDAGWGPGSGAGGRFGRRSRVHPTMADLERRGKRRIPRFAWDFLEGGTGDDLATLRNRRALDAVEILPRYGRIDPVDTSVKLFGSHYGAPVGIAPTGNDGVVWPGATLHLAQAAAAHRLPYILGTLASASIEEAADVCPDQLWFQVYGLPSAGHRNTIDMVRRAGVAGVKTLVLALDAPVRALRPRDIRNGLTVPFRPTVRTGLQFGASPSWALAALRTRVPLFATITPYVGSNPRLSDVAAFVQRELRGTFSWEEVEMLRRAWDGPLVLKGIMHEQDAQRALQVGADGVLVSNHGGRQSDAHPAAVDVLPRVAEAVGDRATVLFDSGIRSGLDVARALALGASAAFSGRGFLTALAALGDRGADHLAATLSREIEIALAQHGVASPGEAATLETRHEGAWSAKMLSPGVGEGQPR